jgi:hypothetical protein
VPCGPLPFTDTDERRAPLALVVLSSVSVLVPRGPVTVRCDSIVRWPSGPISIVVEPLLLNGPVAARVPDGDPERLPAAGAPMRVAPLAALVLAPVVEPRDVVDSAFVPDEGVTAPLMSAPVVGVADTLPVLVPLTAAVFAEPLVSAPMVGVAETEPVLVPLTAAPPDCATPAGLLAVRPPLATPARVLPPLAAGFAAPVPSVLVVEVAAPLPSVLVVEVAAPVPSVPVVEVAALANVFVLPLAAAPTLEPTFPLGLDAAPGAVCPLSAPEAAPRLFCAGDAALPLGALVTLFTPVIAPAGRSPPPVVVAFVFPVVAPFALGSPARPDTFPSPCWPAIAGSNAALTELVPLSSFDVSVLPSRLHMNTALAPSTMNSTAYSRDEIPRWSAPKPRIMFARYAARCIRGEAYVLPSSLMRPPSTAATPRFPARAVGPP